MTDAQQATDSAMWRRSTWMRVGALGALLAVLILLTAPVDAVELRQAAQIEFMHAMSTFACATFMNIGARAARHAPGCFVSGSALYCFPVYFSCLGVTTPSPILKMAGEVLLLVGWGILIWSASAIDRLR